MFDAIKNAKLISVEGADGTGKSTVARELNHALEDSLLVPFPNRLNVTGKLIDDILQNKQPNSYPLSFQSLMLANKIETLSDICSHLEIKMHEPPKYIILARYIESSLVYGALDGIPSYLTIKLNKILPQPDITFILSGKTYKNFDTKQEYYETTAQQKPINFLYLKFAKRFNWEVIYNAKPVTNIVSEILQTIKKRGE